MTLIDWNALAGDDLRFHEEVEMAKGRKVRADEAVELLERWERSGEPMSRWCAARGLNWYSLSAYKGWLCTRLGGDPPAEVAFAEVVVETPVVAQPPRTGRYRVELGEVVVEVGDDFQEDTLRRLLRVVAC